MKKVEILKALVKLDNFNNVGYLDGETTKSVDEVEKVFGEIVGHIGEIKRGKAYIYQYKVNEQDCIYTIASQAPDVVMMGKKRLGTEINLYEIEED